VTMALATPRVRPVSTQWDSLRAREGRDGLHRFAGQPRYRLARDHQAGEHRDRTERGDSDGLRLHSELNLETTVEVTWNW